MTSSVNVGWRVLVVTAVAVALASVSCSGSEPRPTAAWTSPHVASPAVSGVDDTVWVQIQLADSFDVYPDRTCAGRDDNRGMRDQAWVLLRGESTGLFDQTKASARFKHYPPVMYHGKPLLDDDYQYCVIDAVFSPSIPDPGGYSVKFAGTPREQWIGRRISRDSASSSFYRMMQAARTVLTQVTRRRHELP
jgi:hypothetical protein